MAEILFDISLRSKIEAGEYKVVVRYDNRTFNARIICWDFNSTDLLVCVNYGDKEDVLEYDWNGKHVGKSIRRPDLLIVIPESEPEFTGFEKRLWEIMKSEGSPIGPLEKFTDDDKRVFHAYSGQLLALSRKELYPEVDLEKAARYVYESWMGGTMNDVRRDMVELGKVLNTRKGERL